MSDHKLAAQECLREIKRRKIPTAHLISDSHIEECISDAILAERKRCADVARGEVYKGRYRTWPFWPVQRDGTRGNRDNESDLVRHADAIAEEILRGEQP